MRCQRCESHQVGEQDAGALEAVCDGAVFVFQNHGDFARQHIQQQILALLLLDVEQAVGFVFAVDEESQNQQADAGHAADIEHEESQDQVVRQVVRMRGVGMQRRRRRNQHDVGQPPPARLPQRVEKHRANRRCQRPHDDRAGIPQASQQERVDERHQQSQHQLHEQERQVAPGARKHEQAGRRGDGFLQPQVAAVIGVDTDPLREARKRPYTRHRHLASTIHEPRYNRHSYYHGCLAGVACGTAGDLLKAACASSAASHTGCAPRPAMSRLRSRPLCPRRKNVRGN